MRRVVEVAPAEVGARRRLLEGLVLVEAPKPPVEKESVLRVLLERLGTLSSAGAAVGIAGTEGAGRNQDDRKGMAGSRLFECLATHEYIIASRLIWLRIISG